ncbi:hypothetical protein PHLGIDRAFT_119625 [Phlebiopsis gigantea 11061_1 CR5-6]|uniref:non-specific serine/threonine protein kinase n=1 Tax=Phlebiopsis gigantea (strain 11061_1 CR5-6) TaxID=745531 RepID=A0A0C3PI61_PHLG1|nr:hypothetical protein PHLGIDRAFT_119625 [Phlebiopsis gigantea 11061_1 CR5-6]
MTCVVVDEGRLQLLDCIGRGSFGAVYRARNLTQAFPSLLAVKVVSKNCKLQYYWREMSALRRVQRHPNVITMHRWFEDANFIYIVLDYCAGGDMWRAIRDIKLFAGNNELVTAIFLQIIDGLDWCHHRGVYHRDLKPNNILISPDCTRVWVSDFGLASGTRQSYNFGVGTSNYRGPSCNNISGESVPFDAIRNDIWSLGIILINMLTGRMPWTAASKEDGWYMAFVRDRGFLRYTLPISEEADYILQHMLADESENGISLGELRNLVKGVERWWMSDAEVAAGAPHLKRALSQYRREGPLSLPAVDSWDFDSSFDDSFACDHMGVVDEREKGLIPTPPASEPTPPAVRVLPVRSKDPHIDDEEQVATVQEVPSRRIIDQSSTVTSTVEALGELSAGTHGEAEVGLRGKRGTRWSLRQHVRRIFTAWTRG